MFEASRILLSLSYMSHAKLGSYCTFISLILRQYLNGYSCYSFRPHPCPSCIKFLDTPPHRGFGHTSVVNRRNMRPHERGNSQDSELCEVRTCTGQ